VRLHEYQAKALFARYGLTVPAGVTVRPQDDVAAAVASLTTPNCVVKAQIHAGARGKAGGVRIVPCAQAPAVAARLFAERLTTIQTGPTGLPVSAVLIEEPVTAVAELYTACTLDRQTGRRIVLVSAEGGVGIEEGLPPHTYSIDSLRGFSAYEGRGLARTLGLSGRTIAAFGDFLNKLVALSCAIDALLVEINPVMVSPNGELVAGDGKIEIDDNALFRQPLLEALRDTTQSDPKDELARAQGLPYIALDGNIGCLVNGAGLAMATMDLIALAGGRPANFLDVGGGTTAQKVAEALALLASDPQVRVVLVNIFGGIVRCDLIAEGLLMATARFGQALPIVVRLAGTNQEEGLLMLKKGGLQGQVTEDLEQAAQWAVAHARSAP